MTCIASSTPGRLRLRHAALRNPERLDLLTRTIAGWSPVREVAANARTGSLLVNYETSAMEEADFARRCEAALLALLPMKETAVAVAAPKRATRSGATRVRANRLAKRGMLASLAVSMLLAAIGAKRWHIGTGAFFLHALGVHLWAHRRHLFR